MRILIVTSFGYYANPNYSFVHAQAAEYVRQGHKVRVLLPLPVGSHRLPEGSGKLSSFVYRKEVDGVEIFYIYSLSFSNYGNFTVGGRSLNAHCALLSFRMCAKQFLSDFSPDVIHAHAFGTGSEVGAWLKAYTGCPLVVTTHGGDTNTPLDNGREDIVLKSSRDADLVVAVSKALESRLRGCGIKPRIITNYLGCKAHERLPFRDDDALTLVSCSNLVPLKRVHLIIEALSVLPQEIKVQWYHLGKGPLLDELRQLARDKLDGLPNIRYEFCGFVPNEQVRSLYRERNAQLFITTSSTEGLPVSLMEAASVGLPVIATPVGGIPEIVEDGGSGFLLREAPDASEIAEAITKYYSLSPEERKKFSDRAYAIWSESYSISRNVSRMADIYRELPQSNEDLR